MKPTQLATLALLFVMTGTVNANPFKGLGKGLRDATENIGDAFGGGSRKQSPPPQPEPVRATRTAPSPEAEIVVTRPAPAYLTMEPAGKIEAAATLDIGVNLFTYAPETVIGPADEALIAAQAREGKRVFLVNKVPEAIREVESYALPVMLRDQLLASGQFQTVSLRPGATETHDVVVDGRIRKSIGNHLILRLTARDASGREWFSYDYEAEASEADYLETPPDPYAKALVEFTHSLLNMARRKADEVAELARVADVKYAADLAPEVFAEYLEADGFGRARLLGMPSPDDTFWKFAMRCRDEEHRIIADDFGPFYSESHAGVYQSYSAWRREYGASVEAYGRLMEEHERAVKAAEREGWMKKGIGVLGGVITGEDPEDILRREAAELMVNSVQVGEDGNFYFDMNEGLQKEYPELRRRYEVAQAKEAEAGEQHAYMTAQSEAFESHAESINVELFDATLELEGSVDKQFAALRAKLVEVYERETGGIRTATTARLD
ncbi:MAG: hypothetical protein GVY36_14665 [Verrucomicrobia bacterium]|jgi:hypothetical protein|nr:hypothetical protein [Verrucomicrobiota bacterium]